jgi:hypothetical protein
MADPFERSGLVARRVLTDSPLGVEYSFTPLGDTLEAPVRALYDWSRQYSAAVRTAQEAYDADRSRKDARSANKTLTEKTNDQTTPGCDEPFTRVTLDFKDTLAGASSPIILWR